jgi:cell fate regulator YaaT (PSP1 superfamily)
MIARGEPSAPTLSAVVSDQYVVAFGKSGGLGCFTVTLDLDLSRGDRVVVRTPRGLELGNVLSPATLRQARLIGAQTSGDILRRATREDESSLVELRNQAEMLFAASQEGAQRLALPLQILDVELLLDGRHALVQFVGGSEADVEMLAEELRHSYDLEIRFENLTAPSAPEHEEHGEGGCGKPDCGRTEGGGGCTSCSTGGCSSCGSSKTDLRPYFAHLRTKMEADHRTPLL